jgi:hypothetical protein
VTSRAAGFSPPVARDVIPIPPSGGRPAYDQPMPPEESDDPGADTAMFRAFVEDDGHEPTTAPATNRWILPAVIVAVVVVLFAVLLIA